MRRLLPLVICTLLFSGAESGGCGEEEENTPTCSVEMDADGDGVTSIDCGGSDCDDNDPRRYPGAIEICDADDLDEDCDPITFGVRDSDGDGFPDARCCNAAGDGPRCGSDCDDGNSNVHPIAPDVCDGIDNDCDGYADDDSLVSLYVDADGDGHGTGSAMLVCAGTQGYSTLSNDCDDEKPGLYPAMIRCTPKFSEYELCQADGTWIVGNCPNQGTCVVQPGGFGVCVP